MRTNSIAVIVALLAGLCLCDNTLAQKKGGGGKGGGDPKTPPLYVIVDLLGIYQDAGWYQSAAVSVSDPDASGAVYVVGHSHASGTPRPAYWDVTADGTFVLDDIDLGLPPGAREAEAKGVNDAGVLTINTTQVLPGETTYPAWVQVPGQLLQELPRVGRRASAAAINNFGEIVGETGGEGAIWVLSNGVPGQPTLLGDFWPADLNDSGVMAGSAYNELTERREAAIARFDEFDQLQIEFLGVLAGDAGSEGHAISADGRWVCGTSGYDRAFAWSASLAESGDDGLIALGTLGGNTSKAYGVNSSGQVVGMSDTRGTFSQTAFLWENGAMYDLNSIAASGDKPHFQWAYDINEAGYIVGFQRASRSISDSHGFLLIPNTGESQ